MPTIFTMWEEKVESDCSMDCSSPMSAYTAPKVEMRLSSPTGMCRPHSAISVSRPSVFRLTVLPPVFGPVMMSAEKSRPRRMSIGTVFLGSSKG